MALRYYIHLYGDFHQPFHMINRFSLLHKKGDNGAKDFPINYHISTLHSLWDNCMGKI